MTRNLMTHQKLKQALSHVLWIGGATDTGKTTISHILAKRYGFQVYNYDEHDQNSDEGNDGRVPQTLG